MTMVDALSQALLHRGWMLATAESCTGGLIAARCTDLAGSSQWFERGFVTYSNDAKHELLGVDSQVLAQEGAVSEAVARDMALGALRHSKAQVSLAVTQKALLISKDAEVLALKNRLARLGVKVFSAYPARKDEVQALSSVSKV